MNDPTFTFYKYKAYVNTLCLKELSESDFIEILINPRDKLLAVLPSAIYEKDSIRWCRNTEKKIPRHISCKIFSAKVFSMMDWNVNYRYRLHGQITIVENTKICLFDLDSLEIEIPVSEKEPAYAPCSTSYHLCTNNFMGYAVLDEKKRYKNTKREEIK